MHCFRLTNLNTGGAIFFSCHSYRICQEREICDFTSTTSFNSTSAASSHIHNLRTVEQFLSMKVLERRVSWLARVSLSNIPCRIFTMNDKSFKVAINFWIKMKEASTLIFWKSCLTTDFQNNVTKITLIVSHVCGLMKWDLTWIAPVWGLCNSSLTRCFGQVLYLRVYTIPIYNRLLNRQLFGVTIPSTKFVLYYSKYKVKGF